MNKKAQSSLLMALIIIGAAVAIGISNGKKRSKHRAVPNQEQTDPNLPSDKDRKTVNPAEDNTGGNEGRKEPSGPRGMEDGLDRTVGPLVYTKHARCRMECRNIDESEVKEILQTGQINERKSEPAARPDPKYALEGKTHDGQQVRIIFAPSSRGMVVITVIDLDTDWTCHCK